MPFTCLACGGFTEDVVSCPHCGVPVPRAATPLLVITGAGGTGKSAVCAALAGTLTGVVLADSDVVGRGSVAVRGRDYTGFWGYLAAIGYEIARNGLTVVWCGPMAPEQLLETRQVALFPAVHFLALVGDRDVLARRIADRPGNTIREPERHLAVNDLWRSVQLPPPATVTRIDVTRTTAAETVAGAREWISRLAPPVTADG